MMLGERRAAPSLGSRVTGSALLLCLLVVCHCAPLVSTADDIEWKELGAEQWEPDHSSMVTKSLSLPDDGSGGSEARFTFTLDELMPDRAGWTFDTDFHLASQYSDLVKLRMLQLRVVFSSCDTDDKCKLYEDVAKSVRLGVDEDESLPSAYVAEGSLHNAVILHTDFCRHATLATKWFLYISTAAAPTGRHVKVQVRADLPKAHALGATELIFNQPGWALMGMPLEAGEYAEEITVQATAERSMDTSGNWPSYATQYLSFAKLGVMDRCPDSKDVESALETAAKGKLTVSDATTVNAGGRQMWFMAVSFNPPISEKFGASGPGLHIVVDAWFDGAVMPFYNCTGICKVRNDRYFEISYEAARSEQPSDYYDEMRAMFPRRSFPALRIADKADLDGLSHGKWSRYQRAVQVMELELGDTFATTAIHATTGDRKASYLSTVLAWTEGSLADIHYAYGAHLAGVNKLEEALKHHRRAAVLRGEAKDLDEIAYIYMKMGKFHRAEEMYRAVIAVQDSPLAHFALAAALRAGGHNRTGVFQEMEAGLERDPQNADMRTRMGQWRQYEGTSDGLMAAIDAYEKVLEVDSEHILARFLLAQVLYNVGNLRRSVEEYEGVLERHPMHCEARYNIIEAMFQIGMVTGRSHHQSKAHECIAHQEVNTTRRRATIHPLQALRWMDAASLNRSISLSPSPLPPSMRPDPPGMPLTHLKIGYISSQWEWLSLITSRALSLTDFERGGVTIYMLPGHQPDKRRSAHLFGEACVVDRMPPDASPVDIAKYINSHNIHVLVDLDGPSNDMAADVYAHRPARFSIRHPSGWPSSAPHAGANWGLLASDAIVTPPEMAVHHGHERLLLLPRLMVSLNEWADDVRGLEDADGVLLDEEALKEQVPKHVRDSAHLTAYLGKADQLTADTLVAILGTLEACPGGVLLASDVMSLSTSLKNETGRALGGEGDGVVHSMAGDATTNARMAHLASVVLGHVGAVADLESQVAQAAQAVLGARTPYVTLPRADLSSRVVSSMLMSAPSPCAAHIGIARDEIEYASLACAVVRNSKRSSDVVSAGDTAYKAWNDADAWMRVWDRAVRLVADAAINTEDEGQEERRSFHLIMGPKSNRDRAHIDLKFS